MKMRKILFFIFFTVPACLVLLLPNFLTAQTFAISEIKIVGNQRIETETIESYISLEKGKNFEADEINAAYQRVLKSGLFESVTFDEKNTTYRAKARYFELFPIRGLKFLIPREVFILNKNLDAISALIILEDYCKMKFTLNQNINFKTWLK